MKAVLNFIIYRLEVPPSGGSLEIGNKELSPVPNPVKKIKFPLRGDP